MDKGLKLLKHFNFKFDIFSYFALGCSVFLIPALTAFVPACWGWENSVLENAQMLILFAGCWFALRAKNPENKKFFIFVFWILTILILREVNCGRTIFFHVPNGGPYAFYTWKDIPYGYLVNPIYGIYIALSGVYFLVNKLWINLFDFLLKYKLPIFNILFAAAGIILGTLAEHCIHSDVFEEISELIFYISLFSIIYTYSNDKQIKIN